MGGYSVRVCVAKDARERLVSVARTVGRRAVTSRRMVWIAVPPRTHPGPVAPAQKPTAPASVSHLALLPDPLYLPQTPGPAVR